MIDLAINWMQAWSFGKYIAYSAAGKSRQVHEVSHCLNTWVLSTFNMFEIILMGTETETDIFTEPQWTYQFYTMHAGTANT